MGAAQLRFQYLLDYVTVGGDSYLLSNALLSTLTVTTSSAPASVGSSDGAGVLLLLLPAVAVAGRRRILRLSSGDLAWIAATLVLLLVSCGGSKPPTTPSTPGQPSGPSATIYTITVTGTAGTLTHSAILTLTVQ